MEIETYSVGDTEQALSNFEDKYKVELPESYKKFLLKYNICDIEPSEFHIKHIDSIQPTDIADNEIKILFGFNFSDYEEYSISWNIDINLGRIPEYVIPIACDYLGNLICLGVTGDTSNKVYFWDHEEGRDGVILLADTFDSFINSLV